MLSEEPKEYNQFYFEDWYNDRLQEKLGEPYYQKGDLDELYYNHKLVSEADYTKILNTLADAFDKARKMNYEIFTKRTEEELNNSPDPNKKIELEKANAETLLNKYQQAYRDFLGGRNVTRMFKGSTCDYIISQYDKFKKASAFEKQGFDPIISSPFIGPQIYLDGSLGDIPTVPRVGPTKPERQSEILFVATYHDFKEYLESITKADSKEYSASACALILFYLQNKRSTVFRPTVSKDLIHSQLNELGLLDTNYDGSNNAGTVKNRLHEIQKERSNDARTKRNHLATAINFFRQNDYDQEKNLARKDFSDVTGGLSA